MVVVLVVLVVGGAAKLDGADGGLRVARLPGVKAKVSLSRRALLPSRNCREWTLLAVGGRRGAYTYTESRCGELHIAKPSSTEG